MITIDVWPFIQKNSIVSEKRLEILVRLSQKTQSLLGSVAEVGTYSGGSAYLLATGNPEKSVFIFDTFEGLPEPIKGIDVYHKGDYAGNFDYVRGLLSGFNNVKIYKGLFPTETSSFIKDEKFSLVHIDVDLYQSVLDCSEFFYPKMVPGGVIIYDDYNCVTCPGAKKALDEFMLDKEEPILIGEECQVYIEKEEL